MQSPCVLEATNLKSSRKQPRGYGGHQADYEPTKTMLTMNLPQRRQIEPWVALGKVLPAYQASPPLYSTLMRS